MKQKSSAGRECGRCRLCIINLFRRLMLILKRKLTEVSGFCSHVMPSKCEIFMKCVTGSKTKSVPISFTCLFTHTINLPFLVYPDKASNLSRNNPCGDSELLVLLSFSIPMLTSLSRLIFFLSPPDE